MAELVTDSGLIVQGKLADDLIESRAQELFRQLAQSVDAPVSFATRQSHVPVGLGSGPTAAALLNEVKGWPAIANRATMDRIAGFDWFAAERVFDSERGEFCFEKLPEHPLNDVLYRPNPMMSGRKLRMLISGLVQHTGACYLQKLRDPLGVPRELWPIPTQLITPVADGGAVIGAYQVLASSGQTFFLPVEDVVRIWRPDLKTIWGQLGVLGPQALEYDALKFMTEHLRAYFQHDGTPRVALMAEPEAVLPDAAEKTQLLSAWRRSHNRRLGSQIGLPVFIPQGFKVHEFSSDQVDEGMAEFEDRWARQIMAAAGVPRFAVGLDTNTNRATAETSMWAWDRGSNEPLTALIADDLTTQLAQPDYFDSLAVRFEDFVSTDKEFEKSQEDQDLRTGVHTVNQVREAREMEPVPWGNLPRAPFSEQPYTGEVKEDDGLEDVNDLRGDDVSLQVTHRAAQDVSEFFEPEAVWQRNLRIEKQHVGAFSSAQLRVWDAQRLEAHRKLAAAADVDEADLRACSEGTNARERRSARRRVDRSHHRAISVEDVFLTGVWQALYAQETAPVRAAVLEGVALETATALAPDVGSFVLTGFMEQELRLHGAQHIARVDETTRKRLAIQLAESASSGESISQLTKRLDTVFQDKKRSRTVARTEIGAANQTATLEGFRLSKAVKGKQWNSSRDGAVRDSHQIDGQQVPLASSFTLRSGVPAAHPLDRSLPVEELANCRCFTTPILIDEPKES